jgi:hypothetical protein
MSLQSIQNILDYYQDQDEAMDRFTANQHSLRTTPTDPAVKDRVIQTLWMQVQDVVMFSATFKPGTTYDYEFIFDLDVTQPNDIIDAVVEKIKAKGFQAQHSYNDGYPTYDWLFIGLPENCVQKLWGEMV